MMTVVCKHSNKGMGSSFYFVRSYRNWGTKDPGKTFATETGK
jgi:hypothetical protein